MASNTLHINKGLEVISTITDKISETKPSANILLFSVVVIVALVIITIIHSLSKKEESILMLPFTPRGKDNLAAWMVARNDNEYYNGKISSQQYLQSNQR